MSYKDRKKAAAERAAARLAEDEGFMREALKEAQAAFDEGEAPVGCVIVREKDGRREMIASAHNTRERDKRASAHAEHDAIDTACRALGGWRLTGCTLYVTLEPCPMCAGLISSARIERVVYGAKDPKAGAYRSVMNMLEYPLFRPKVTGGVLEDECGDMLRRFFSVMRIKDKEKAHHT